MKRLLPKDAIKLWESVGCQPITRSYTEPSDSPCACCVMGAMMLSDTYGKYDVYYRLGLEVGWEGWSYENHIEGVDEDPKNKAKKILGYQDGATLRELLNPIRSAVFRDAAED